jgi:transcription elongation factor Elf1
MFLTLVEPADKPNQDRRYFQCAQCAHSEVVMVKYK